MFSENLKKTRQKIGLSQKDFAQKLEIQQSQYSRYEIGTSPSTDILNKLIQVFNININYLLTGEGSMFITPELKKDLLQFKIPKGSRVLLEIEN